MTSIAQYRRTVADYIRNGYGVDPGPVNTAGRHSKFAFTFDGRRRTIVLNDRNGAGGSSGVEMKLQDVRRELGEPTWPGRSVREKKTLDDMTSMLEVEHRIPGARPPADDVPLSPNRGLLAEWSTWVGRASLIASGRTLCLVVPRSAREAFGHDGSCRVDFTYPDVFVVRRADAGPRIDPLRGIRFGAAAIHARIGAFRSTPITFRLVGGTLEGRLPEMFVPRPPQVEAAVAPDLVEEALADARETIALEPRRADPKLEALRLIREVETTTVYRLRKVKTENGTVWEFAAPTVRLEE